MNTRFLIDELAHPDAAHRLTAARILGVVDEVDALPALTRAFKPEIDPHVRSTMQWAGRRLREVQAQGYSTFMAIWEHFQLQRELDALRPHSVSHERLDGGLDGHHLEMLQRQAKLEARRDRLSGGVVGMMRSRKDQKKLDAFASSTAADDLKAGRRIPPAAPTRTDIRAHVQRLLRSPDESARRKAAVTLVDVNNPEALAALAQAFVTDPSPAVTEAAQQSARRLYWNLLYYEMDQDGTILREIERRRRLIAPDPGTSISPSAGQTTGAQPSTPGETTPNGESTSTLSAQDLERQRIEDLLKRGREKREHEKRRRK